MEQHRARHRSDAARHGGYGGGLRLHLVEADVPDEAALLPAVDADVDHDGSLSYVLGPDHLPLPEGDDEHVGPGGDRG